MKTLATMITSLMFVGTIAFSEENKVSDVISTQIKALNELDFQAAYEFASPSAQEQFTTPANFKLMVQAYYPMMLNAQMVEFLDQRTFGNLVYQRVTITDTAGRKYWFAYEMVIVGRTWRINGVTRSSPPGSMA